VGGKELIILASAIIEEADAIVIVLNRWSIGEVWSLPGGQLEPGEALQDTLVREVAEETGLVVEPLELAFLLDAHNQVHNRHFLTHVFQCRIVGGQLRPPVGDPYVVDARWVKRDEVGRYISWPVYRDPLVAWLNGVEQRYYLDRDAYRPELGKGPERIL
jgi:8-oxo-dGTP diphosphatase